MFYAQSIIRKYSGSSLKRPDTLGKQKKCPQLRGAGR